MPASGMIALAHEWVPIMYVTIAPLIALAFSLICKTGEAESRRTTKRLGNSAMRRVMLGAQFGVRVHRATSVKVPVSMLPLVMLCAVLGVLTLSQLANPEARSLALEVGPVLYVCIAPLGFGLMAIVGPYFEKPAGEEAGRPSKLGRGAMRRAAMHSIRFIVRGQRNMSTKAPPKAVSTGAHCRFLMPLGAMTAVLISLGVALFYVGMPLESIHEVLPVVYVCVTPVLCVLYVSSATCRERAAERVMRMGQRVMRRAARQFELESENSSGASTTLLLPPSPKEALPINFESVIVHRHATPADVSAAAPATPTDSMPTEKIIALATPAAKAAAPAAKAAAPAAKATAPTVKAPAPAPTPSKAKAAKKGKSVAPEPKLAKAAVACGTIASATPSTPPGGACSSPGSLGAVVGSAGTPGATGAMGGAGASESIAKLASPSKVSSPPLSQPKGTQPKGTSISPTAKAAVAGGAAAGAVPDAQAQARDIAQSLPTLNSATAPMAAVPPSGGGHASVGVTASAHIVASTSPEGGTAKEAIAPVARKALWPVVDGEADALMETAPYSRSVFSASVTNEQIGTSPQAADHTWHETSAMTSGVEGGTVNRNSTRSPTSQRGVHPRALASACGARAMIERSGTPPSAQHSPVVSPAKSAGTAGSPDGSPNGRRPSLMNSARHYTAIALARAGGPQNLLSDRFFMYGPESKSDRS